MCPCLWYQSSGFDASASSAWRLDFGYPAGRTAGPAGRRVHPEVYWRIRLQGHVRSRLPRYGRGVGDQDLDDGADALPVLFRVFKRGYTARQLVFIDTAAVVLLALFCLFVLPRDVPKVHGTGWRIAGAIAYSVAALGVLLRRRLPLTSLVLVETIAFVAECLRAPGPTPFYAAMALYSVVAVSSRRKAGLVVALVAAGVLASSLVAGGGGSRMVLATNGGLALVGVAWLAGAYTRANRAYQRHLADRAAEKAAALEAEQAEQVRRAVADERVEIARELHDIVAHAMSVIAVRSGVARVVIDTQPEQAREALAIIETTTRRSLQEMRLLVGVLRRADEHQAELGPVPGLDDLDRLLADIAAAGVAVEVQIDGEPRRASSGGQPVRLPDRAGSPDQRGPSRWAYHRPPARQLRAGRGRYRGGRRGAASLDAERPGPGPPGERARADRHARAGRPLWRVARGRAMRARLPGQG